MAEGGTEALREMVDADGKDSKEQGYRPSFGFAQGDYYTSLL